MQTTLIFGSEFVNRAELKRVRYTIPMQNNTKNSVLKIQWLFFGETDLLPYIHTTMEERQQERNTAKPKQKHGNHLLQSIIGVL